MTVSCICHISIYVKMITSTEAAILTALSGGELYGLALVERTKEVSSGKVRLSLGSVYPTLYRMEQKGLVKSHWGDNQEAANGARRRYYKATGVGQRALRDLAGMIANGLGRLAGSNV